MMTVARSGMFLDLARAGVDGDTQTLDGGFQCLLADEDVLVFASVLNPGVIPQTPFPARQGLDDRCGDVDVDVRDWGCVHYPHSLTGLELLHASLLVATGFLSL